MGKIKVIKPDEKQKAELETGRQSIIGEMLCEEGIEGLKTRPDSGGSCGNGVTLVTNGGQWLMGTNFG